MKKVHENKFIPTTENGKALQAEIQELEEFKTNYIEAILTTTEKSVRRQKVTRTILFAIATSILGVFTAAALSLASVVTLTAPLLAIGAGVGLGVGVLLNTTVLNRTNERIIRREINEAIEKEATDKFYQTKRIDKRIEKLEDAQIKNALNEKLGRDVEKIIERQTQIRKTDIPPAQRTRVH